VNSYFSHIWKWREPKVRLGGFSKKTMTIMLLVLAWLLLVPAWPKFVPLVINK